MTQKLSLENEQIKQDEDDNQMIDRTIKHQIPTQIINDNNNLSFDNSLQTSQLFTIDHPEYHPKNNNQFVSLKFIEIIIKYFD